MALDITGFAKGAITRRAYDAARQEFQIKQDTEARLLRKQEEESQLEQQKFDYQKQNDAATRNQKMAETYFQETGKDLPGYSFSGGGAPALADGSSQVGMNQNVPSQSAASAQQPIETKTMMARKKAQLDYEKALRESTPEGRREIAIQEGEKESIKQSMGKTNQLSGTVKRFKKITDQYIDALPSEQRTPFEQRIYGSLSVLGAQTGFKPNAKLLALKKQAKSQAIQIIKGIGEVGSTTAPEQKSAENIIKNEGLTDDERKQQLKIFAEATLSGASQESLNLMSQDENIMSFLSDIGANIDGLMIGNKTASGNAYEYVGE